MSHCTGVVRHPVPEDKQFLPPLAFFFFQLLLFLCIDSYRPFQAYFLSLLSKGLISPKMPLSILKIPSVITIASVSPPQNVLLPTPNCPITPSAVFSLFFFIINLLQLEANYFTILWRVLPYIGMNQPWMYMCPPIPTTPQPPSPSHPLGCPSAPALSALFHVLNLDWSSVSHMAI